MFSYELIDIPESLNIPRAGIDAIFLSISHEVPLSQNGLINIAFIDDERMQWLNRVYRGKDSTTDVLSFHYFDDFSQMKSDDVAGEIVLSHEKIISQAHMHAHTPEKETQILVLHGLLHILGFDHETDDEYRMMWKYEKKIRDMLSL